MKCQLCNFQMFISTASHSQMFMSTAAVILKCSCLQLQSLSNVHFSSHGLYQLFISTATVILKCSLLQPVTVKGISEEGCKGKNSHISHRKCRLRNAFIKLDPNLDFAAAIVHHLRFRSQGAVRVQRVRIKLGLYCLGCNNRQAYIQKYWPH